MPTVASLQRISLEWNCTCRTCGISVSPCCCLAVRTLRNASQVLTGEPIHDLCRFCGPKGKNLLPRLPPYPAEWNAFIDSPDISTVSRILNNMFSLTALGVNNGVFFHFNQPPYCVTLNGGRVYHR
ncbi:hypothetical protein BKA62DRAFT_620641, partial [Auriculariales sp. MPI-PUGE-AT-0066]